MPVISLSTKIFNNITLRCHSLFKFRDFSRLREKTAKSQFVIAFSAENLVCKNEALFGPKPGNQFVLRLFFSNVAPNVSKIQYKAAQLSGLAPYGPLHAGLQINGQLVHWLSNSLVKISPVSSATCFFLVSPSNTRTIQYDDAIATKICEIVAAWNGTAKYDLKFKNCHHFANQIIRAVMPDYTPDALTSAFVSAIIDGEGVSEKSPGVRTYTIRIPSLSTSVAFSDHEELDKWQASVKLTPNEILFLKAFHRGFQVAELSKGVTRPCKHYPGFTVGVVEEDTLTLP